MELSNEIVLRPRFKFNVEENNNSLLDLFETKGKSQSDFVVTRVDDHVFIRFPKAKQHFWSPQLHLEINEDYDQKSLSTIYGLFGPNPTVWTMFMFFHFVVAGFFIGFAIWAYVNWSLDNSYAVQLFVTLFMIVIWFALYLSGRMGKRAGLDQMHELHHFMRDTLRSQNLHSVN
ncbi:GTP-binding protein [Winogradskyella alexanderae]|uniref:GTP-binding protein n=1 Tax=Winogradskyella alexanderae TaxID=2877123 RepID=A0ABS7XSA7_9FLAO|nr:GTP-binding protein [Winogradskyella alexanderae]MCA0132913.1 GTP-binding protein [Winogradskyella alexanderae]